MGELSADQNESEKLDERRPRAGRDEHQAKPKVAVRRTSEILREIISDESQQVLTVEQIVKALGPTSFGTSLMACCDIGFYHLAGHG